MSKLQQVGIEFEVTGDAKARAAAESIQDSLAKIGESGSLIGRGTDKILSGIERMGAGAKDAFNSMVKGALHLAATLPAIITAFAGMKAWEGFQINTQIDQATKSLGTLMKDQTLANGVMEKAIAFGQQYGFTQAEMATSVSSAAMIIGKSKKPIEEQLSALARLATLNPEEGFQGAVFAMKELMSGDVISLVERFNLSKDAAYKMRDAIAAGQDPIMVLNAELEKMGVTTDVLANRMEGPNGALLSMQLAGEKAAMAIGKLAEPAIIAGLQTMAGLLNDVATGIDAWNTKIPTTLDTINSKLLASTTSYETYAAAVQSVNDKATAQLGIIGYLVPGVDALSQAEYRYVQAMMQSGMTQQQALTQLQAMGTTVSTVGSQIDLAFSVLQTQAPAAANALMAVSPQLINLAGTSESTAAQVRGLIDQFQHTGDIEAFRAGLAALQTETDKLKSNLQLFTNMGENALDAFDALTDRAWESGDASRNAGDEFDRLTGDMILASGAAYQAEQGFWDLTDAQYANIDADLAKQITSEQNKQLQADLELAVLKVENGLWSQAAATQYLATQYGMTATEAENLFNKQVQLAAIQGNIEDLRKNIASFAPPKPKHGRGGRGGGGKREEKQKTPEEIMKDSLDLIDKGVDALGKLKTFVAPTKAAFDTFSSSIRTMVLSFYGDLSGIGAILKNDAAGKYAKAAKEAVDVIGSGVDALMKLHKYQSPTREVMTKFSMDIRDVVVDFFARTQEAAYTLGDVASPLFARAAKDAVETINSGVDALMKLHDYRSPLRSTLFAFSHDVRDAVVDFWHRAQEIKYALADEAAPQFAEMASKVLATIGTGVDALMKLQDYVSPSRDVLFAFSHDLRDAIADFWHRAQEINYALDDAAPTFADIGTKVVSAIGSAIEAFVALKSYTGVPRQALTAISNDIATAVAMMSDMARQYDLEATKAVAEFAEATTKILAPFKAAIDMFGEFEAYSGIAPEVMVRVGMDIEMATAVMQEIADRSNAEGVERATTFANAVSTIFGALKTGIEALDAIRTYESIPSERMGALLADFMATLGLIQEMNGQAQVAIGAANQWRDAMQTIADSIRAGAAIIGGLNGLSVMSTISVAVGSGGAGMDGTVAPPAIGGGGGGGDAAASNTTINYNYNASYAAPPASPAVGFDTLNSLAGG